MMKERRKAKRIERPLNIKFSFSHEIPHQWNVSSVVLNISALGVKFLAPDDLIDKTLDLEIQSPRWYPRTLKLQAVVLESTPSEHFSFYDVRAKFINLSEDDKKDLSLLEKDKG